MWKVLRPDASAVLQDSKARKSLSRYFSVIEGKIPARFQICKRVGINIKDSASDNDIWEAHDQGLKDFQKLLTYIDGGKMRLEDLSKPDFSLLDLKVEIARRILKSCHFCERRCGVDRTAGERGLCGVGDRSRIASEFMHHGEEGVLVPSYTIFFTGCSFQCQFCQNWDISQHPDSGVEVSPLTLAKLIKGAKNDGARNVNFVGGNPDPNLHTILAALNECEISLSSVWNSNMYYSLEAAKLLFGTQDIYLTDFKWFQNSCALRYSKVPRYLEVVARNHKLAFKDSELIIRHLVMPGHLECCTRPILGWIAENIGANVRVNVMDQYRPCYKACEHEEINRQITREEHETALKLAEDAGLTNLEP